ncbi:MAG: hypothetical protein IKY21_03920 [Clostridia bacterium]|nr:hypothetical protein [Clostridia bacterium]
MNVIKWKNALYLILGIATIVSLINWALSDKLFTLQFVIDCIGKSASVITISTWLFCYTLWKLPIFKNWLVLIPDLQGLWEGEIKSDWIDPIENIQKSPIACNLLIHQSLFKTCCRIETKESVSMSAMANFSINSDSRTCKIIFTYQNDPKQTIQNRSPIHFGTTVLDYAVKENERTLSGYYWTNRKTTGELNFKFVEKY